MIFSTNLEGLCIKLYNSIFHKLELIVLYAEISIFIIIPCFQVCIHKMLQDPHIVKYYGQRSEGPRIYLFLEYAPGGELFDRIG